MPTFKDEQNREWSINIRVGSLDRIKSMTGIDFLDMDDLEQSLMTKLLNDPVTIGGVAWAAIFPQAQQAGVSREQFLDALLPATALQIRDILMKELPDFFLEEDQREGMLALIRTKKKIHRVAFKKLSKDMSEVDENELSAQVAALTKSSIGVQESVESTLPGSDSGS
jgi:hypothetical protein